MGLIVTVRGLGAGSSVKELDSAFLARALAFMLKVNGVTKAQLMEARNVRAPEIAALAAQRATDEDIRALEDISRCIEGTRSDEARRSMFMFHIRLAEACGNPVLTAAMIPVLDLVEPVADLARIRARERHSPADQSAILAVIQAVKARDAHRARAAMPNIWNASGARSTRWRLSRHGSQAVLPHLLLLHHLVELYGGDRQTCSLRASGSTAGTSWSSAQARHRKGGRAGSPFADRS